MHEVRCDRIVGWGAEVVLLLSKIERKHGVQPKERKDDSQSKGKKNFTTSPSHNTGHGTGAHWH